MTIGSLCSGYGGLDLALPDGAPAWHAETDPDASAVLATHWPAVPNLGDVTTIDWSDATRVDVMTAGFPCQPVSVAGQKKAGDDRRWLWPHVLRAIRETGTTTIFLENVENLASIQSGAILTGILADLRAAGYTSRWCVLGACAVGAAHHRHRFFLRAVLGSGMTPAAERVTVTKCGAPRGKAQLPPTPPARDGGRRGGEGSAEYWRHRRQELGRTNGMPLGAAVSLLFPSPRSSDGAKGGPNQRGSSGDLALPSAVLGARFGVYAMAVTAHVIATGVEAPEPTERNRNGALRLAPPFAEWLMCVPAGWVAGDMNRVAALRLLGNGVVPRQAAEAWRVLGGAA